MSKLTLEESNRAKQLRARARREQKRVNESMKELYRPIEEWDDEELARGRPRDRNGNFTGLAPRWVSRQIHEEAVRRFTDLAQSDMRAIVPRALRTIEFILDADGVDKRGRPLIPPSVKLQAAQWVVEHLVGKPTQRIETDISVKLQGILAQCLVVPGQNNQPAIDVSSLLVESGDDEDD